MYTPSQQRIIARELARAGGHVEKALEVLRLQYESLDRLSEGTIRNLLKRKGFPAMVREQEKLLHSAQKRGDLQAERVRAEGETLGKDDLIAIVRSMISRLHKRVAKEPDNLEAYELLRKYIDLQRSLTEARRQEKEEEKEEGEFDPNEEP